ncbi:hypothetical protein SAMD00019534_080030, partial [Acytostelium subglobosum LB1]|uniref:hypothetical protein n=1 Tax=Acytostelium subglobosum LB1 TaxID=1410327 RepID=UPI000645121B
YIIQINTNIQIQTMATVQEIITKSDEMYERSEFAALFTFMEESLASHPEEVNIMWRVVRSYFERYESLTDVPAKVEILTKAIALVNRGLELEETNAPLHKWWAIITSSLGDHGPTKDKIANAFKIRDHIQRSLELNPSDPTTMHLMGRFYYQIANISWVERTIATALFGALPVCTFQDALDYFLKSDAVETSTIRIRNGLFIADTYYGMKDWPKSKEWYLKVAQMVPKSDAERAQVKQAHDKGNS